MEKRSWRRLARPASSGSLSVLDPCYKRNLSRTVQPAPRAPEPHEGGMSLMHRTSSVPSGIGDVALNVGVFSSVDDFSKSGGVQPQSRLPTTPQQRKVPRELRRNMFSRDNIPEALKALSYWDALEVFDVADTLKTGSLDKGRFFRMMLSINRRREGITRAESDELFDKLDIDESGIIDKEEFLSWTFGTHSIYCGNIRRRLEHLNESSLRQFCARIDSDGNGQLDRREFFQFMSTIAFKGMSKEASDELFSFVDADKSGFIDTDEFLNWIHPSRNLAHLESPDSAMPGSPQGRQTPQSSGGRQTPLSPATPTRSVVTAWGPLPPSSSKAPLFEMRPREPVVLEFTVAKNWEHTVQAIERLLYREYDATQIKVQYRVEPYTVTCGRLVANIGRGIVLWDRPTMLMYREDPFVSIDKAFNWIGDVLAKNLPTVLKTAALRKTTKDRRRRSHSKP